MAEPTPHLASLRARARPGAVEDSARYSRFVGLMRVVLPLTALLLLGLVVVWPMMTGTEEGFRLSFLAASPDADGRLRMENARYMGTDRANRPYTITAAEASRADAGAQVIDLKEPKGDITLAGGNWVAVTAKRGRYDQKREILDLEGAVSMYYDVGYEFHTERAQIDLAVGTAKSLDPVSGQGPLGLLHAGGFRAQSAGRRLLFTDRVSLVVYPRARG